MAGMIEISLRINKSRKKTQNTAYVVKIFAQFYTELLPQPIICLLLRSDINEGEGHLAVNRFNR